MDYLYKGSERSISNIITDENVIRKVLDGLVSEKSAQSCAIPISFDRRKYERRNQRTPVKNGI